MTQKAFKYRFYPTSEQETLLRRTMGCARLVYNRALAARNEAWYERKERVGYSETSTMLTSWKKQEDLQFLNEVSSVPLQQGLRHLQTAFTNFFAGRAKYPNFKKKHHGGNAEFTKAAFRWKDSKVYLAKCSQPLDIRWSRHIPEGVEPSTITVKLSPSGRWTVSLLVDVVIETLPESPNQIGLDLGINSLMALSNGEKIANPQTFKAKRRKLRQAQKALSRKKKGSNNRDKARLKVAKVHAEISDARNDFIHKLTTRLVRENQLIAVEDLSVKNLVKNHKLALSISDAAWGEAIRQLEYIAVRSRGEVCPMPTEAYAHGGHGGLCPRVPHLSEKGYKCAWYGRTFVMIDRWFPSSKRCSNCGYIVDKLALKIREWDCPKCSVHHDRDENAGKNILAAFSCGECLWSDCKTRTE
jgi:putative transposase